MNIFYIHESPIISAKAMSDKHVVKMILESAQLMSTAHHKLDSPIAFNLYKPTHVNHPSNVWVRESAEHYEWLYQHFLALCDEYSNRYHKVHATYTKLNEYLKTPPIALERKGFTEPPCAMPDIYKVASSLLSYRKYYESEKFFNEQDRTRYNTVLNTQGVL
jgi:hypothetical protein